MNHKGKSTLANFGKILNLKGYAENTVSIYLHYISEFIAYYTKPALHITLTDIKSYVNTYKFSSKSQQNQIYSAIKLFAKHLLKINLSNKIFLERPRKIKKLPQVIDQEHILTSISKITNLKHKAIITLAYSVGLRVSEIINLKIEHIDSKRNLILIANAKCNKDRNVPISGTVLILLRDYYRAFRPKVYLFNGQYKDQYTSGSCNKIVKKYLGEKYHFHLLRHSCFTHLLEKNTDLRVIQELAGHSSSKTTEIYTHVSNNVLQKIQLPI